MADAKRDVNGWVRNPGYEIGFDVIPATVRVMFGGVDVGKSSAARGMYELGHAPVYYLPQQDVDMRFLDSTDQVLVKLLTVRPRDLLQVTLAAGREETYEGCFPAACCTKDND